MDTRNVILIILAVLQGSESVAVTSLTQETPCLSGQSCRLKCSVVAGVNDKGLHFYRNVTVVVACLQGRDSCQSSFPGLFHLTQENYNTSYVDILTFDTSSDAATWSCSDGLNGARSILPVVLNVLPTGSLTWGSTCVSGRVTSPASLSCSGLSPGNPPANRTITDSSIQTVASSQTGSVTWTVTRGGQASCSVTWSAFPSFPLDITTTQCDVQDSSTAVPVGAIVGGVLGLIALVVIIVVIVFLWRRKKSRGEDGDSLQKSTKESVVQGKPNPAYVSNSDEENSPAFHPILEYNVLYDRSYNSPNQSQSTSAVGDREAKKNPNNDVNAVPKKKKKKSAEKGNTRSKTDKSSRGGRNWAQDSENSGPVRELRDGLPYSTVEVVPKPGQAARPVRSKKTMPDALYNNEPVDYVNIDHTKRS